MKAVYFSFSLTIKVYRFQDFQLKITGDSFCRLWAPILSSQYCETLYLSDTSGLISQISKMCIYILGFSKYLERKPTQSIGLSSMHFSFPQDLGISSLAFFWILSDSFKQVDFFSLYFIQLWWLLSAGGMVWYQVRHETGSRSHLRTIFLKENVTLWGTLKTQSV